MTLATTATPASGRHPLAFRLGRRHPRSTSWPDLDTAIYRALLADGPLRAALPGGLYYREAPPDRPGGGSPYAIYQRFDARREDWTNEGDFRETGMVKVTVLAGSAAKAARIADRAERVLAAADLRFDEGWMLWFRPERPLEPNRPRPGPGAVPTWQEDRAFAYEWHGRTPFAG